MPYHLILRQLPCCILACLFATSSFAAQQAPEHDLKAAFIYNFIQFTEWPEGSLKGQVVNLCASSGTLMYMALQAISGKTSQNRTLSLKPIQTTLLTDCNVLIADHSEQDLFGKIRTELGQTPVLTIIDGTDPGQNQFLIGMNIVDGRITFIIDKTRATALKLSFSSRLLRLAAKVQ